MWSPHILHMKLDNLLSLMSFILVIVTTEPDSGGRGAEIQGKSM